MDGWPYNDQAEFFFRLFSPEIPHVLSINNNMKSHAGKSGGGDPILSRIFNSLHSLFQ
jgi:hypothetical protein